MNETLRNGFNDITIIPQTNTAKLLDISDHVYFGSSYKSYVSNSRLGLINPQQGGSPKQYFEGLSKNNKFSDSLIFGSALHGLVLQPESYVLCEELDRPSAKVGYIADYCYMLSDKSGKMVSNEIVNKAAYKYDYYSGNPDRIQAIIPTIAQYLKQRAKYESDKDKHLDYIYLSEKQRESLKGCLNSMIRNANIQNLLNPNSIYENVDQPHNENTITCDVIAKFPDNHEIVLSLKSKLDNFTTDQFMGTAIINDVKTTSRFCSNFNDAFHQFHYYREFGMYAFMLTQYLKNSGFHTNPEVRGNCLVVETTTETHDSSVFPVTPSMFAHGVKEFVYLLRMVAYYTRYGYSEG